LSGRLFGLALQGAPATPILKIEANGKGKVVGDRDLISFFMFFSFLFSTKTPNNNKYFKNKRPKKNETNINI
jgi:hypothetical protein